MFGADPFAAIAQAMGEGQDFGFKIDDSEYDAEVEVSVMKVDVSNKPQSKGVPYFVFEGTVRKVAHGATRQVGDKITMARYLLGPGADRNVKLVANLCAAVLGVRDAKPEDIKNLAGADNLGAGARIRVITIPREGTNKAGNTQTYYNPHFAHISLPTAIEVPF